eukprot:5551117-Prymnesium_polylepis.1
MWRVMNRTRSGQSSSKRTGYSEQGPSPVSRRHILAALYKSPAPHSGHVPTYSAYAFRSAPLSPLPTSF